MDGMIGARRGQTAPCRTQVVQISPTTFGDITRRHRLMEVKPQVCALTQEDREVDGWSVPVKHVKSLNKKKKVGIVGQAKAGEVSEGASVGETECPVVLRDDDFSKLNIVTENQTKTLFIFPTTNFTSTSNLPLGTILAATELTTSATLPEASESRCAVNTNGADDKEAGDGLVCNSHGKGDAEGTENHVKNLENHTDQEGHADCNVTMKVEIAKKPTRNQRKIVSKALRKQVIEAKAKDEECALTFDQGSLPTLGSSNTTLLLPSSM